MFVSAKRKFDRLNAIRRKDSITDDDIDFLEKCAISRNVSIRIATAENLCISNSVKAEKILLRLLKDKDEMVRVNACDSLRISQCKETIDVLKHYVLNDTWLIRGYAICTIADIALKTNIDKASLIFFLEQSLQNEMETWVKVSCYRSLYMLGKEKYLSNLMSLLHDNIYYVRCMVTNCLADVLNDNNAQYIYDTLKARLQLEDPETKSVISSIEGVLQNIREDYPYTIFTHDST